MVNAIFRATEWLFIYLGTMNIRVEEWGEKKKKEYPKSAGTVMFFGFIAIIVFIVMILSYIATFSARTDGVTIGVLQ